MTSKREAPAAGSGEFPVVLPPESKISYFRPVKTFVPWAYLCAMVHIQQHSLALLSRGVDQVKHGEPQRYYQLVVDISLGKKPASALSEEQLVMDHERGIKRRGPRTRHGVAGPLEHAGEPPPLEDGAVIDGGGGGAIAAAAGIAAVGGARLLVLVIFL